jgi:methionine-rich copper-binding protein CopC
MRNIRVADPRDRVLPKPSPATPPRRSRGSRIRDAFLTVPIALLVPAILMLSVPAAAGGPTLSATPATTAAGATVTLRAEGFPVGSRGAIFLDDDDGTELASYRVNKKGKFKVAVVMPADVKAGKHTLRAESDSDTVTEIVVSVTAVSAVAPKPVTKPAPVAKPAAKPAVAPAPAAAPVKIAAPAPRAAVAPAPAPKVATTVPVNTPPASGTILIDRATLMSLPTSGTAWAALKARADRPVGAPNLSNQDDPNDVTALAKALVYARTGVVKYRTDTITMLKAAVGTEYPGDALGVARGVAPLVLAADLVGWRDPAWMSWLSKLRTWANPDRGYTLISMHEKRPNNWGTHAGAGRIAADLYLRDMTDLARAARVFKGYLGDRASWSTFSYGSDRSWQANASLPVGINPAGVAIAGTNLDGILPDDMRRGGSRPSVGDAGQSYTWEALQGILLQAELLSRNGYPAWGWQNRAILRAFSRIHALGYPATGDDRWQPWLVNRRYGTSFPAPTSTTAGKSFGYADWLYS